MKTMQDLVRKIFGNEAADDKEIVSFYEEVNKLAFKEHYKQKLKKDFVELKNQWIEDGDLFKGKDVEGRYKTIYVKKRDFKRVNKIYEATI